MTKKELVIIADYSQPSTLTFEELCDICHLTSDMLNNFIEHEIIHARQGNLQQWSFDLQDLERIKTAMRLQRDLEINLAGAALVLSLLDELETLRSRTTLLEKHLLKL